MKVKELIRELLRYQMDAEVVISKDVDASGYGFIDKIKEGYFEMTDDGNDFHDEPEHPDQFKAVCLVADRQEWVGSDYPTIGH